MQERKPFQGKAQAKKPAMPKASTMPSEKLKLSAKEQKQLNNELINAAKNGNINEIERLVKKGASIDAKDKDDWTALMWAAWGGYTQTCEFLLDHNASIDAKDYGGRTALMKAAFKGRTQTCALLLEKGADLNMKAEKGYWQSMTASEIAEKGSKNKTAAFLSSMPLLQDLTGKQMFVSFLTSFGNCLAA
jgi:ankyrin repeat protein